MKWLRRLAETPAQQGLPARLGPWASKSLLSALLVFPAASWAKEEAASNSGTDDEAGGKEVVEVLIKPSKETTFFTKPVGEDGYVDILAAANQFLSDRTSREDNGAVEYLEALGGRAEGQILEHACKELDVEVPDEKERFIKNTRLYGAQRGWDDAKTRKLSMDSGELAAEPWSAMDHPEMAEFLEHCEPGFEKLKVAVSKKGWYIPRTDEGEGMVMILLSEVQEARQVARCLLSRATLRMENQQYEEAWDDIMLARRFARKIAQGPTLIEALVGLAIEGMSAQSAHLWLRACPAMYEDYDEKLAELRDTGEFPPLVDSLMFERLMFIDVVTRVAKGGFEELNMISGLNGGNPEPSSQLLAGAFETMRPDYNYVLREGNAYYDELEAAYQIPVYDQRAKALAAIEEDLQKRADKVREIKNVPLLIARWALFPKQARKQVSELTTNVLFSLLLPALTAVDKAYARTKNNIDVLELGMLLKTYHAKNGQYPKALADLDLDESQWNLTDRISRQPFKYRREGNGFVLYNFGHDGVDDGGPKEDGTQGEGSDFGLYLLR